MKEITPEIIAAPLARYAHGIEVPAHWRLLRTSGQLALDGAGKVPDGAEAQARLCFENIRAILAEAGMGPCDVAHLTAYVTDRAHMAGYMAARDAFLEGTGRRPASTLLVVAGFTRPEFLVEVEVMAAAP